MVRAKEVAGMTSQQIQQHVALPSVPTHMTDVKVPAGTAMQMGHVNPQPAFGAPNAKGWQYQPLKDLPNASFTNTRKLQ